MKDRDLAERQVAALESIAASIKKIEQLYVMIGLNGADTVQIMVAEGIDPFTFSPRKKRG